MGKEHIGSHFDDFLTEEAMLGGATAVAIKRLHTSRAALNRLLDEEDPSLTLTKLASAAAALGRKVNIQLTAG